MTFKENIHVEYIYVPDKTDPPLVSGLCDHSREATQTVNLSIILVLCRVMLWGTMLLVLCISILLVRAKWGDEKYLGAKNEAIK